MNAIASATAASVSGPQLDNRRVLAALIDLAVVGVGAALILAAGGVLGDSPSEIGAPLIAVTLGWALYYYFACESSESAQTLGKRAMKIRVVRMDGAPTDMRDIAVRTVVRVVDMQFAYLVGLLVMLATGERRGRLGDLAAGTKIVSADAPASAPVAAPPAAATVEEPTTRRVPIAESGPAFEPVVDEEDTADLASASLQELAADVEATAGTAPDEEAAGEEEPVAEEQPVAEEESVAEEQPVAEEEPAADEEPVAEEEPVDDDLVDEDPLAGEEDQAIEAEGEPVAEEDSAPEPVADPEPDSEPEPEDDELAPAAEAEGAEGDNEVERIETISAIDLVMEDSRRKS